MELGINMVHRYDPREGLKKLGDESVDCVVTSPPYWSQRDYGFPEQIGMEETPEEFCRVIGDVFEEVLRVLKDTGTLWMNIGDTYWGGKGQSSGRIVSKGQINRKRPACRLGKKGVTLPKDGKHEFIRPKELVGIPWMAAFEMRRRGWMIRQDIIWHKPNCMPESVEDRCTKAHEYIFLFTKGPKYYYDAYAIGTAYKEKTKTAWERRRRVAERAEAL